MECLLIHIASKRYGIIPCAARHVRNKVAQLRIVGRFGQVFIEELETKLKAYLFDLHPRFYGLTKKDIRQLAFNLTFLLQLPYPFSKTTKMAREN